MESRGILRQTCLVVTKPNQSIVLFSNQYVIIIIIIIIKTWLHETVRTSFTILTPPRPIVVVVVVIQSAMPAKHAKWDFFVTYFYMGVMFGEEVDQFLVNHGEGTDGKQTT